MRIMVDINVFMDVILDRKPQSATAARILDLHRHPGIELYMPAHGAATILYLTGKTKGHGTAAKALSLCLGMTHVGALDETAILKALSYGFKNAEDAMVAAIADTYGCDFIVTGNVRDFSKSPVPAISPVELLNQLNAS